MSASASTQVNIFCVCLCTFTPKSNHLWTSTYMSAFVPSTFQLMHGYMSIVNTMLVENNLNVCTRQHWLQRIIIMCVRRQQPVCLSTFTTVSCVHAYMYVHFFIAFDPCMCAHVNRQPKPCAVLTITSILAVTIHIACIGMYIHVSISFNPSQHLSCTSLCTFTPKSNHLWTSTLHVSICAFDLTTNAWVHVNRKHYALSKITWMCVSIGFNASHHHVCTSTTACMSKLQNVLRPCTYIPSFPSILACVYMSIVTQSPMRCRQ